MITPSGATVSAYTSAINSGNKTHVRITFEQWDIVLTDEDIELNGGLELASILNSDTDLTIGKAVMNELRVSLFKSSKTENLPWKDEFKLEMGVEIGGSTNWITVGYFTGVTPDHTILTDVIDYTAHDRMSRFDILADDFLANIQYPATLSSIYSSLCAYCGVTGITGDALSNISSRSFAEAPVEATGYTCREVLAWIAEACGCYARIDNTGKCTLVWYKDLRSSYTVDKDNIYGIDVTDMGLFGSFTPKTWNDLAQYTWDQLAKFTWNDLANVSQYQIQGVRVAQTENDYGVTVPDQQSKNVYLIVDNPYLIINADSDVTNYVTPLYDRLHAFDAYIPMSVECVGNWLVEAGDFINVEFADGSIHSIPIFCRTLKWNGGITDVYECTGTFVRQEVSTYNKQKLTIGGKLHEVYQDIDKTYERIQNQFGDYYTKTETASMVTSTISSALGNYYTKTETASMVTSTISSALGDYYTKTETASLVTSTISSSLGNYYTKTETASLVTSTISSSLGNYYTKTETASLVTSTISSSLGNYYTKTETASLVTSTISSSLGNYYTKTETASLVTSTISSSLGNYYTKSETASMVTSTISDSLGNYYTKTETSSRITSAISDNNQNYYTKTETASMVTQQISDSLGNYYTKTETASQISYYVGENAYGKVSGIVINSNGVTITGSKTITLTSGGGLTLTATDFTIDSETKSITIRENANTLWHFDTNGLWCTGYDSAYTMYYEFGMGSLKYNTQLAGSRYPSCFIRFDRGYMEFIGRKDTSAYRYTGLLFEVGGNQNNAGGLYPQMGHTVTLGETFSPFTALYVTDIGLSQYPTTNAYITNLYYTNMTQQSSRKVKHNIADMPDMGSKIDALRPVSYVYNSDITLKKRFGLIYEETVDTLPEICTKGEADKGISYTELIPVLLKEIQNLRARVAQLEGGM